MGEQPVGPGELTAEAVGHTTISRSFMLTARQIMAYAAAVNDPNEFYFDDLRPGGLMGHPFMAFSFQWNTRFSPHLPVNERALPFNVHATTDLRIFQPFREGDLISCQGRIISTRQITPGVLTTSRYSLINGRAEKVAELDMGGITRGATLQGSDAAIEPAIEMPTFSGKHQLLWEESVYIAPQAAQTYTECAQIYNPIHTERKVATAAGLPDIILHGSATQAISMSQIIHRCLEGNPARVLRYVGQLRALVLMDSHITIRCLGIEPRETDQLILFEVLNAAGEKAVANGLVVASLAS